MCLCEYIIYIHIYTYIYIYIYTYIIYKYNIHMYIYTCLASPLWGMNHYVPTEWWCVDLPYALPKYKVAISPANLIWHGRSRFSTPWNGGCLHIVYIIQNLDMFCVSPGFWPIPIPHTLRICLIFFLLVTLLSTNIDVKKNHHLLDGNGGCCDYYW